MVQVEMYAQEWMALLGPQWNAPYFFYFVVCDVVFRNKARDDLFWKRRRVLGTKRRDRVTNIALKKSAKMAFSRLVCLSCAFFTEA
jgi:hypothetical protein